MRGRLTSQPPRYACFGGPLDGMRVNVKFEEFPPETITFSGLGQYVIQHEAQGFDKHDVALHTYLWADDPTAVAARDVKRGGL